MKNYYNKSSEELLKEFNTSLSGIDSSKVHEIREVNGFNELLEGEKKSLIMIFLEQFKDFLVFVLLGASIISFAVGNKESTIVILVVLIMNAILGTVQHLKAEASLKSLKALSAPNSKVIRDGHKIEIPSKELIPGDIVLLEAGDFVAADGRLIDNYSLQVNESSLTGESINVDKSSDLITEDEVPLAERTNMVFSGSLVTYGRGTVLVTGTGMNTEIGKIAQLLKDTKEKKTPLQKSLDDFGKKLTFLILGICFIIFFVNISRGLPLIDSVMFSIALAVAAIPEALSSIVTIVLALGTQKMAKEGAIVKKLKSVESLGSVSIICSDKTGTLTQNKMKVKELYINGEVIPSSGLNLSNPTHEFFLKSLVLCNDSSIREGAEIGDPTEVALVKLAADYSKTAEEIRNTHTRKSEIPFDSDRKLMSTTHEFDEDHVMITKGAVDVLINKITSIETVEGIKEITQADKDAIEETNKNFSKKGLRVLALVYKNIPRGTEISVEDEGNYTFVGLVAMIDPPREESAKAVADCKIAGIKPVMITGDHKITASAIAKEIGILDDISEAIEGKEIDHLSKEELKELVPKISVYARVTPEHKIRIVEAWQERGMVVAMTGDGVNDAPALKQADIGIAMGITGTEVSKDAASMILTDDNFATIVKAVVNGRNIYANIKNSIKFLLSGNAAGILSVLYASIVGLPLPFAPVHLLFINLVTDSLPAIALGVEKQRGNLLNEKPRNVNSSILSAEFLRYIASEGILITIATMSAYYIGFNNGGAALGSTLAFSTLCLARLFHSFNCRGTESVFKIGLFTNKYIWYSIFAGAVLLFGILNVPALETLFLVAPLTLVNELEIILLALAPTVLIQLKRLVIK
ncbi:cation-translocating P-type ATPase [Clostridium paridis]|uniref:P-type Ca(2+) transporter n=1 Tax=Clostridium paridis TaxID=2803863 RepID=A0A937K2F5_9CLOT|nr:cation-translocating P-type ATPase [Clostridium paridis]MBL4931376.1 cation-translocating P-type ATPase [Clostridium paridis]